MKFERIRDTLCLPVSSFFPSFFLLNFVVFWEMPRFHASTNFRWQETGIKGTGEFFFSFFFRPILYTYTYNYFFYIAPQLRCSCLFFLHKICGCLSKNCLPKEEGFCSHMWLFYIFFISFFFFLFTESKDTCHHRWAVFVVTWNILTEMKRISQKFPASDRTTVAFYAFFQMYRRSDFFWLTATWRNYIFMYKKTIIIIERIEEENSWYFSSMMRRRLFN